MYVGRKTDGRHDGRTERRRDARRQARRTAGGRMWEEGSLTAISF